MLKLLVGPMKAEKTGELIRLVKRASIGNKNIVVLSPQIDERTVGEVIESRNGSKVKAFRVQSSELIENYTKSPVDIVFIDEVHMWDEGLVREVCKLTDLGIDVVCSGLDMNYMSAPFEIVSRLLALADEVEKLTSVCEECGSDKGRRTARYINGKPASFNSPEILVDGTNTSVVYKTFCNKCYRKIGMFGLGGYPMKNVEIPQTEAVY